MKARRLVYALGFLPFVLFSSCESDILNVKFDTTLYQDFTILQPTDTIFEADAFIDAVLQSSDIAKYKDNIENVTVKKVTYQLLTLVSDPGQVLKHGEVYIGDTAATNIMMLAQISNKNLQSLFGNETELPLNQVAVDQLAKLVKNDPHKAFIKVEGSVNTAGLDFSVRVKIYIQIEAKPL